MEPAFAGMKANNVVVPAEHSESRNRQKYGATHNSPLNNPTPSDNLKEAVAAQLGRTPAIAFQVAVECPHGWPAVLENAPFTAEGQPNPNLFYLCCPHLRRRLSQLEGRGWTGWLEQAVSQNEELRADLEAAQQLHAAKWARKASRLSTGPPIAPPLIAAARQRRLIKCLHAHYAFYLVYPRYQLGELISQKLTGQWCSDERCTQLTKA